MICYYLFRCPFFCDQWSLYLLHIALTYFKSIFNGIIMIILDVGTWYDFIWIELSKGTKSTGTFEMSFSRFGPFRVWGVTNLAKNNKKMSNAISKTSNLLMKSSVLCIHAWPYICRVGWAKKITIKHSREFLSKKEKKLL